MGAGEDHGAGDGERGLMVVERLHERSGGQHDQAGPRRGAEGPKRYHAQAAPDCDTAYGPGGEHQRLVNPFGFGQYPRDGQGGARQWQGEAMDHAQAGQADGGDIERCGSGGHGRSGARGSGGAWSE